MQQANPARNCVQRIDFAPHKKQVAKLYSRPRCAAQTRHDLAEIYQERLKRAEFSS
jgi:hypothetical protein